MINNLIWLIPSVWSISSFYSKKIELGEPKSAGFSERLDVQQTNDLPICYLILMSITTNSHHFILYMSNVQVYILYEGLKFKCILVYFAFIILFGQ